MKNVVVSVCVLCCVLMGKDCLAGHGDEVLNSYFTEHAQAYAADEISGKKPPVDTEQTGEKAAEEFRFSLDSMRGSVGRDLEEKGMAVVYIEFPTGKSEVSKQYIPVLEEVCAILKKHGEWKLRIEGHTDKVGSAERNRRLSLQRAEAVGSELVKLGISHERLSYMGYGPDRPLADGDTAASYARNRRVELHRW